LETDKDRTKAPSTNGYRFVFDEFEVDPSERTCYHSGACLQLTGKAFDLLVAFVENPNRLLTKEELMERVWPDEFVEEGNLARNVSTLRKALGDNGKSPRFIATVQGHGYRFLPEVSGSDLRPVAKQSPATPASSPDTPTRKPPVRWILIVAVGAILLSAAWLGTTRFLTPANKIKTLAVLPLKSLDENDNFLRIGIADALIRNISKTHQLTVRPTSAVLRYAKEDTDALTAAKELNADAVLDGTVQRSGDRLRVSINLLRTTDGASLWTDNFDMPAADIFAVQDKVAQQVTARLQLHIDSAQRIGLDNKYPANPVAYEFYIKGIFSLDQRGYGKDALPQMQETLGLIQNSIAADPNYAMAHAQLAWASVWTALFIDPSEPKWADIAREEIKRADELDPQIAETHLAKAMLFWSRYENYQNDAAIRELLIAQQLNPNTSHGELVGVFGHLGLEDLASRELAQEIEIDPTSQSLKELTIILPFLRGDADAWFESVGKSSGRFALVEPWYYMRKGRLDDAKKAFDERLGKAPELRQLSADHSVYMALRGNFREAEAEATESVAKVAVYDQVRHHLMYDAACVYALAGDAPQAVDWLRQVATNGFPDYPLFARDPYLDRIRRTAEFKQFISEQREQYDRFREEAGEQ
jgi:DNA-binding winged helix-turn-helix (wHTH) protein/TolB-like protein